MESRGIPMVEKLTISLDQDLESLSSRHAKNMARLRHAEELQENLHDTASLIKIMKTPEFDHFYRNEFQAYKKGLEDVQTTGDEDQSDNSYLDVVEFIQSLFNTTAKPHHIKVTDREHIDTDVKKNPRIGNREGITYSK